MQKDVLVTVVIPTYNRANIIINTIKSVLSQTYQNFEILVIDDGSTDNTKEVVLGISDNRIKYFYQENAGAQAARNAGLRNAKGKFISFLDCADEWFPSFIEKCLNKFQEDNALGCVYCLTGIDGKNGDVVAARIDTLEGYVYKQALEQGYITSPLSIMMKKECFDTICEWDENLKSCQDDDICFRLAKEFKFGLIPEVLVYVNIKDGTGISSSKERIANGWFILWQKYKSDVLEYCGKRILIKHYKECLKLFKKLNNYGQQRAVLKEIIKLDFKCKYILEFLLTYLTCLFKKEKIGNKRKITILGFIKISYKIKA